VIDTSVPGIFISGDQGRLGQALRAAAPGPVDGWDMPALDLDDPVSGAALVRGSRPRLVIHTAAMTAVDQAAREPDVALRRNGEAVAAIAQACRETGAGLLLVSTNEVFSGDRTDGRPYLEDDPTGPRNPYGASKLAGELAALAAFDGAHGLWIVRTAWLFGPPGSDFPDKIALAADKVEGPLPVVTDEIGCPTYAPDLARAIYQLVERTDGGVFHLVNAGSASRYAWAEAVLAIRRPGRQLRPIGMADFQRSSEPPPWGVLDTSRATAAGVELRPWQDALSEYLQAG
jgi:dTDP-4-dehydrorhamnose reductase